MLEMCPNCNKPVISFVPGCNDHRSSLDTKAIKPKKNLRANIPKKAERAKPLLALDEIVLLVSQVYRLSAKEIKDNKNILHYVVPARRQFIYSAVLEMNYPRKEVASYLAVSMASIYNGVVMTREAIFGDREIEAKSKAVQAKIAEALANKDPGA
jgi:hypothetical protein